MTHCAEDDLILYYYGESRRPGEIARHLAECAACEASFRDLSETLKLVAEPHVPERGEQYGLEVWQRIRHRLPGRQGPGTQRWGLRTRVRVPGGNTVAWARGFATAGALAALLIAAFLTGRVWEPAPTFSSGGTANRPSTAGPAGAPASPAADDVVRDRILLTSVADHLERSERVLTDLMNAPGGGDISPQQERAEDLVQTGRIYRQDALDAGERSVAMVLEQLERTLLELVHSPSPIGAADLEQMRRRIDAAALLFKVRVLGDELRQRETRPADAESPVSTQKVS